MTHDAADIQVVLLVDYGFEKVSGFHQAFHEKIPVPGVYHVHSLLAGANPLGGVYDFVVLRDVSVFPQHFAVFFLFAHQHGIDNALLLGAKNRFEDVVLICGGHNHPLGPFESLDLCNYCFKILKRHVNSSRCVVLKQNYYSISPKKANLFLFITRLLASPDRKIKKMFLRELLKNNYCDLILGGIL